MEREEEQTHHEPDAVDEEKHDGEPEADLARAFVEDPAEREDREREDDAAANQGRPQAVLGVVVPAAQAQPPAQRKVGVPPRVPRRDGVADALREVEAAQERRVGDVVARRERLAERDEDGCERRRRGSVRRTREGLDGQEEARTHCTST